jgi:protein involved in polysaccharide export with SLBB domain
MDFPTLATTSPNAADLEPYRIQVGDRLAVRFYRNPELDQEAIVRPDGKISLPFIDDVLCAGLAPNDLDHQLTRRYAGELTIPDITVVVLEFGNQRAWVTGQVMRPGMIDVRGPMTVYAAIKQAGGFDIGAKIDQVILIRKVADDEYHGRAIDLREVEYGRAPMEDVPLRGGDMIHVPNKAIANMGEWVNLYIRNLLPISPTTIIRGF